MSKHYSRGMMALAMAVCMGAGFAHAAPVRFENPAGSGHFDWSPDESEERWLDIKLPAVAQLDIDSSSAIIQRNQIDLADLIGGPSSSPALAMQVGGFADIFVEGVAAGTPIPSGLLWNTEALVAASFPEAPEPPNPEGIPTYLGIRFDIGLGDQYGWIGVVRTGILLDAFAWGYETVPGVPIAAGVPEPASLSLLVLGALGLSHRRRNRA